MYVSARERQLIDLLIKTNEAITVNELASELNVSTRTVHRDLQSLEQLFDTFNLELIKKSGLGIQLKGPDEQKNALSSGLENKTGVEYTPEERQTYLLCELLETGEPIKLHALAHDLKVTVATVSHDLDEVESWLASIELTLMRKRGYGVKVEGSERDKRRALSQLLVNHINESEFVSFIKNNLREKASYRKDLLSNRLLGMVNHERLETIEKITEQLVQTLPYQIADSAFVGLTVHLALAVERLFKGEEIEIDADTLSTMQSTEEYHYARQLAETVESIFKLYVPEEEIGYITMHLRGAKRRHDQTLDLENTNMELAAKARRLIGDVEKETGQTLTEDPSLYRGLVVHLERALYRIRQNLRIDNPLLDKVIQDYEALFLLLKRSVKKVFTDIEIPDEEIGFLVMHFGAVLEHGQSKRKLSALTICSSGIGTSKMLATQVQKNFPSVQDLQNASLFDLNHLDLSPFDLIISTIPLPLDESAYVLVNPFLPKKDVQKIQAIINDKQFEKPLRKKESPSIEIDWRSVEGIDFFQNIQHTTALIIQLMNNFKLFRVNQNDTVAVLKDICNELKQSGVITESVNIVEKLMKREEQGGLGIPNTSLALFHTRSESVMQASFTIHPLEQPLTVRAMDGTSQTIKRMMLLLAPADFSTTGLELLSLISASVIENEQTMKLFETADYDAILDLLSTRFKKFLNEKINE